MPYRADEPAVGRADLPGRRLAVGRMG